MNDLNDKLEERWQQRRKKGYNWTRLIVLVVILIAVIYGMNMLKKMGTNTIEPMAEVQDSTAVIIPEPNP
ncbi:MAG: hypothetical protein PWP64_693 [Candidatus Cloacimonadota bacterium]|jgi:flagellar basal body-associated protein FliL|nr:hypothetical protein [Candidatus Cloacimonadota bacterium]